MDDLEQAIADIRGRPVAKWRRFASAINRFVGSALEVAMGAVAVAIVAALMWWALSPILGSEYYRLIILAAIIGGLVVKYVL